MEEKKRKRRVALASSRNYSESKRIYAQSLEVWHNLHKEEVAQISARLECTVSNTPIKPKKAFTKVFGSLVEIPLTKAIELEKINITIIYQY